jgi:hypothetical protein
MSKVFAAVAAAISTTAIFAWVANLFKATIP